MGFSVRREPNRKPPEKSPPKSRPVRNPLLIPGTLSLLPSACRAAAATSRLRLGASAPPPIAARLRARRESSPPSLLPSQPRLLARFHRHQLVDCFARPHPTHAFARRIEGRRWGGRRGGLRLPHGRGEEGLGVGVPGDQVLLRR